MKIRKVLSCKKCKLHLYRRNVVLGRGIIPAKILFMGEAPGRSENLTGEAFVGRAGKILDQLIIDAEINSFYIINVLLCRPTDYFQGGNREPEIEEVLFCMPNIMKIIKKVNPQIFVLLGKVSQRFYGEEFPEAIHLHHPAFLVRQGGIRSPYYQQNLRKLKEGLR